jgi:predicted ATPase
MEQKMTHLERIEIKNLWEEVDIDWQLDSKVNILIGVNGSGKTTLLGIIDSLFNNYEKNNYEYDKVKLSFNDHSFVISERHQQPFDNPHKYQVTANGDLSSCGIDKISTFDVSPKRIEQSEKIATELDILLEQLIDDFKGYQLKLRNLEREETSILDEKIKELSFKDSATAEELQELRTALRHKEKKVTEIYQQKNQFLLELNSLFEGTHKVVDFDKNNSLIFLKNGKTITPYRLSAGEKQILIILLKVILQENQPAILLMDEPELSLHLAWQLKLIDTIQRINENCQLIIATHAPGILNKGWRDKITKMENITFTKQ